MNYIFCILCSHIREFGHVLICYNCWRDFDEPRSKEKLQIYLNKHPNAEHALAKALYWYQVGI